MENQNGTVIREEWLTRDEAIKQLNRSQASIERLVRAGALRSQLVEVPGRKPMRVYAADSVQKLKRVSDDVPMLRSEPKAVALAVPETALTVARELVDRITSPRVPLDKKLWLTLEEAVLYSGRTRALLLRECREGVLRSEKDGGWKIQRASLEAFAG